MMKDFARRIRDLIIRSIKSAYWIFLNTGYRLNLLSVYNIPIVINNFNRLTHLIKLLDFLEKSGFTNIIILDNNSTYPPLLEFYKKNKKYKILRETHNYGHLAFWKSGHYHKYKWGYFAYTDPDVLPIEQCPENFMQYFYKKLHGNYLLDKIGFGIKIDDLPDSFSLKKKVIEYETRYWKNEVEPNIYKAPIDSTFALYKPFSNMKSGQIHTLAAYRTGFPYLIRHLPWYIDSKNLSEEDKYYWQTCNDSSSIAQQEKGNRTIY